MTEINHNIGLNQPTSSINNINFEANDKSLNDVKYNADKEINDLGNSQAEVVGRSMVNKKPKLDKALMERINGDLAFLDRNPNVVRKANILFEKAIAQGMSPDKAAIIAFQFVDDFRN